MHDYVICDVNNGVKGGTLNTECDAHAAYLSNSI